jgi:uncharacterized protein
MNKGFEDVQKKLADVTRLGAEKGLAHQQYQLGDFYFTGTGVSKDYEEAARWFKLAAEQGFVQAQYNLGVMYEQGLGVQQDYCGATMWLRLAAKKEDGDAQYKLGVFYLSGLGVTQNFQKAAKWFEKSAELGISTAQLELGLMYMNEKGVPFDLVRAHKWFSVGLSRASNEKDGLSKGNREQGRKNREKIEELMTSEEIHEAQERAKEWKEEHGDAQTQFLRGFRYQNGKGVGKDYNLALKWYRLAAKQGHDQAQYFLGGMLVGGKYVPQDIDEGIKWMGLSAKQGNDMAQYCIGVTHKNLSENYEAAVVWLELSAGQGNKNAQYELGEIYKNGQGIAEDFIQAHMWFNIAETNGNDLGSTARYKVEKHMTQGQIIEAQKLAMEWMKEHK